MSAKDTKTNASKEYFLQRIDEIRMSDFERIQAKARFERAEAVAEALATAGRAVTRLFTSLTARPAPTPRRPVSSAR
jgi:hypothetical protein